MFAVPTSARAACWLNAWLSGRESADAVITGLLGHQTHMEFAVSDAEPVSAALLLGELRKQGVRRVSMALPSPGDPLGLGGPAAFNADAIDEGEALILYDVGTGLVPRTTGRSTRWEGSPADPPGYLPDVAGADRELRATLTETANALAALDVAAWNPDAADALMNLHSPARLDTAMPFPSGEAARAAVTGFRCQHIVDLAFCDDGGALSSWEVEQRRTALVPLHRASRAAIMAACSSLDGR